MSIYEYDEEKHIQQERKQAREEGIEQGIEQEIFRSVFENDYSTERGAEKLNFSKELFEEKYQKWLEEKNK
ncbi:MAG: hypothetical protein PHE02_14465 [Lachnospiraceae bacterium]|nr:hypothetical protein [Lachnospiraceae bacterium]